MPGGEATAWHIALSVFGILSAEIFWRLFSGVPAEFSPMCMRMRWALGLNEAPRANTIIQNRKWETKYFRVFIMNLRSLNAPNLVNSL